MQIRFLLGAAGSGKTFRCLTEIRETLLAAPAGPELIWLAPRQATYQLERQLLSDGSLAGYTRLQVLSFERLARHILENYRRTIPRYLDEEGRLMVLRSLLARKRHDLKLFRASARLTGFAQQLSLALRELQQNQLTPQALVQLATQVQRVEGLSYKLQDLAVLLQEYLDWLEAHGLQDADSLLDAAALALEPETDRQVRTFNGLWVDGFAEYSESELGLLAALIPHCERATLTFCLDHVPKTKSSWLSSWFAVQRTLERCRTKLGGLADADLLMDVLPRDFAKTRFAENPVLRHLESNWGQPRAFDDAGSEQVGNALRVAICSDPEAEVTLAAREILRHVRAGGRYRDVTIRVRTLSGYHHAFQRIFSRYEIPLFLDRRESVSHHPLAELTRSALRTVASDWRQEDWFAALKTGLVPTDDLEIDRLENEALARGWKGSVWQKPIEVSDEPELTRWLAGLHRRLVPPFQRLALDLAVAGNKPNGRQLAAALREFWSKLHIEEKLNDWAAAEASDGAFGVSSSVHSTVWVQMNTWLDNVELAFPDDSLSLKEWLPILEAGLSHLSVGVIPPALDQVLVGTIDRSRNPDSRLAIMLGWNESVFPSSPEPTLLLTETDRSELEKFNPTLGSAVNQHLQRERYYAYVACTRASQRLVLTAARSDARGTPLNPSPFLSLLRQLFPSLKVETVAATDDWRESEHLNELIRPLLKMRAAGDPSAAERSTSSLLGQLSRWPPVADILDQLQHLAAPGSQERLDANLAERLYGPVLRTSVSRMEQFAACPFRFFVHSGLRAQERKQFELDIKEQGSFQHDVLAIFHQELQSEKKRWRDVTPEEARERVAAISRSLMTSYREGLLQASEETRFMARILTESLQDFVEILVRWMHTQYRFNPAAVELPFGEDAFFPPWTLGLAEGRRLELHGRIDRIDLFQEPQSSEALCVVIDYKSSQKQLDPVLIDHGLQLQLLAYLNVLRRCPNPRELFGVAQLIPAGVFYVNLRGKYERGANRTEALAEPDQARKLAYRHTGRFDLRCLRQLDGRPEASEGDQFNYRLTNAGSVFKNSREAMETPQFERLLDSVETSLRQMGQAVYSGHAEVSPYKKGAATACDQCSYRSICRIDPWIDSFRVLRNKPQ